MSARRSLPLLAAFVLAGAGSFLLLVWIYDLLGWVPTSGLVFNLLLLGLIPGAVIGLLMWLGFVIGRRRASRPTGSQSVGMYLRGFGLSLLVFLVLGTVTGLLLVVPLALGQTPLGEERGSGAVLLAIASIILYLSPAVVPFCNGLLTGGRARPGAFLALGGSLLLAIGGLIAYLLPLILLIVLFPPACSQTVPQSCGLFYFGTNFQVEILAILGGWAAVTVGLSGGVTGFVGVFVFGLTESA